MSDTERLSYESRWDRSAATPEEALIAVDGSASEAVLKRTGEWNAGQVKAALDLQPTDRVLELGCGVGRIGLELLPHCAEWHGADISNNMLQVAREWLGDSGRVKLHKLDRTELTGLEDDYFDKAYCVAVFIHMDKEDVYLYLRELARVLKPGGRMYFETWNLDDSVGWRRWMMEVNAWAANEQRRRKDVSRNQFTVIDELRLFLEHAGLTEVASFTHSAWLQVVAALEPDADSLEAMRENVEANAGTIRYSEHWNHLFRGVIEVLCGDREMQSLLEELGTREDPETALFRDYLKEQVRRARSLESQ